MNNPLSCLILVVDDDPDMRSLLVDEFSEEGCQVLQASDGDSALNLIQMIHPTLIITDLNMKKGGFAFLQKLKILLPHCPIIVMTAFGDAHSREKTLGFGGAGYFDKPVRIKEVKNLIKQLCPWRKCNFHLVQPKLPV